MTPSGSGSGPLESYERPFSCCCDFERLPSVFNSTFFRARFRRNRPSVELGVELDRGQRVCACLSLVHPHLRPTPVATSSTRVLYSALYAQYTSSRLHETPRSTDDASDTIIYRRTIAYAPTQTEYPQVSLSPIISCNLLRLVSLLYYSLITTTVLSFPLGSSRPSPSPKPAHLSGALPGPA